MIEQVHLYLILVGVTIGTVLALLWSKARRASMLNLELIRLNEQQCFDLPAFLSQAWPLLARSSRRGIGWRLDGFGGAKDGQSGGARGRVTGRQGAGGTAAGRLFSPATLVVRAKMSRGATKDLATATSVAEVSSMVRKAKVMPPMLIMSLATTVAMISRRSGWVSSSASNRSRSCCGKYARSVLWNHGSSVRWLFRIFDALSILA